MKIVIIEDEPPTAKELRIMIRRLLGSRIKEIRLCYTIEEARRYLSGNLIDLCFLDLNLNGQNGLDLLSEMVAGSFHTIVVSAHIDQAIKAYEYGVLDFVPKPIDENRLMLSVDRYFGKKKLDIQYAKYLSVRKNNRNYLIQTENIEFFKAVGYLIEIHEKNGNTELIEKPLRRLEAILPPRFIRVHRSYIIDRNEIKTFYHKGGGLYRMELKSKNIIPINNEAYKFLKEF